MVPLETLHLKPHRSGGDDELALDRCDARVAMDPIAVADVLGEGVRERTQSR